MNKKIESLRLNILEKYKLQMWMLLRFLLRDIARVFTMRTTAITVHLFRYPRYRLHKFAKQAVILDFNFNAFYTAQFWTLKFSWFRNNTLVNFDIHNSWVSHVRNCLLLNRMLPRNVKTTPTPMRFLAASASNVYISQQNCCFSFIKSIDLMMDLIVISNFD